MKRTIRTICSLATLAGALAPAGAAPAAADDARGFLYGTVVVKGGTTYTGLLRWGNEESFWDDHFNGTKVSEPATGKLPEGYRPGRKHKVEVFGRYEYLNLDDGLLVPGTEDTLHVITIGANYYMYRHNVKFTADLQWLPNGSPFSVPGVGVIQSIDEQLVLRLQAQLAL